jgi:hypothetical protein
MACELCHRWCPSEYWAAEIKATPTACAQVRCMACGTLQCHGNGGARGTCKHCWFGRLIGWSFSSEPATCQYKGCKEPAVYAYLPGSKPHCCKAHGDAILARRASKRAS